MTQVLSRAHNYFSKFYTVRHARFIFSPEKSIWGRTGRCHSFSMRYMSNYKSKSYISPPLKHPKVQLFGSRYHPGPAIERAENRIKELLQDASTMTVSEWDNIREELLIDYAVLSNENIDSVIMNCVSLLNKYELARSFMKFLKEIGEKPNIMTYLNYMVICGKHVDICGQELILKTFKKVKSFFDTATIIDARRLECVVQGLHVTEEWRTPFEYLKKLPIRPTLESKNCFARGALRNDEEMLAWEIITDWYGKAEVPSSAVFNEYVSFLRRLYANDSARADRLLMKLFGYLQFKDIIMKQDTAEELMKYFSGHNMKWKIEEAKIDKSGECLVCKKSLRLLDLSYEDFNTLKQEFFERAVKKSDVYINSTEAELNRYMNFIEKNKPFHLVLDGLNTAYTYPFSKNHKCLAKQLLTVVKQLSGGSRRLLVLGRQHMRGWPTHIVEEICRRAAVFFTNNISEDDPFLIYAALASGPHTLFLSSDLMRDHLSRLEDVRLIQFFKNWQQSHQMFISTDDSNKIKFSGPLIHSITIQGSMTSGWHIPFDKDLILDSYEELNNWLCIQRL